MKQKIISLLIIFIVTLFSPGGAALASASESGRRPSIAFFYVDDLKAGLQEKEAIKRETIERFAEEYAPAYKLQFGESYESEFAISRFTDLKNLDRFDLLPRLASDRVDYAVFYNVLPLTAQKGTLSQLAKTMSHVHVRVFDVRKNAYVSDTELTYTSRWAWLSGHCEKLFADADDKVFKVLFPERT